MVRQIDADDFYTLLNDESKPIVICDFFATWCGPCKMLAPVMEKMSEKYGGRAEFIKVDIDKNPELAVKYGIMSIPLVTVFVGGKEVDKSLGYMDEDEADEFVSKNL